MRWLGAVLVIAALLAPPAGPLPPTTQEQEAAAAADDKSAILQKQIEHLLKAAKKNDSKQGLKIIDAFRMPGPETWFTKVFGAEKGPLLAANYKEQWPKVSANLQEQMEKAAHDGHMVISVERFPYAQTLWHPETGPIPDVLADMRSPVSFYRASLSNGADFPDDVGGLFFVSGDGFCLVPWRTLNQLGNLHPFPGPVRLNDNVQPAKLISGVAPVYPPDARRKHIEGTVVLGAIIGTDGSVNKLSYLSGPSSLVNAAMDAVRQWRYQPTQIDGKPVQVELTFRVDFTLGR